MKTLPDSGGKTRSTANNCKALRLVGSWPYHIRDNGWFAVVGLREA